MKANNTGLKKIIESINYFFPNAKMEDPFEFVKTESFEISIKREEETIPFHAGLEEESNLYFFVLRNERHDYGLANLFPQRTPLGYPAIESENYEEIIILLGKTTQEDISFNED